MTPVVRVAPARWRETCAAAIADGGRLCGLFADGSGPTGALGAAVAAPDGDRLLLTEPRGGIVDSVVELAPAVGWDEREAHDVHGVRFVGHVPLRPLVDHPSPVDAWAARVAGRDVHQVAVGPIHAGVIESGHFRFHVVGERILHLDVRLFYKRRGIEAAAVGRPAADAARLAGGACGACTVANGVAAALAVEQARGLEPDAELRRARVVLIELERLYNHLNDVGAVCAGVGFAPGASLYAVLKERVHRLCARIAGHRFLFGAVAVGGGTVAVDAATARAARAEVDAIVAEHRAAWRELRFTPSLRERLVGVGVADRDAVERLGGVGPAARAAGVARDARGDSPRLAYGGFRPILVPGGAGDVAARVEQRAREVEQTAGLLAALLDGRLGPGAATPTAVGSGIGLARVEGPRGETVCAVRLAGDRIARLWLRTGSYANWQLLAHAAIGELLPEFPLINKSFELCYACVDR
ncbi:MAG: NADH-quinone oxidoreductase subunit F [Solirubrobacterales bacterium]|nr:NADH-quinone oxidoreductase subunit F [Solirubrobacterales bacterium]